MSRIFISYRRDDSGGYAGRLYDRLAQHFDHDQIFMDIDTIEPGLDFVEVIEEAVGSCDVLIALIGKQWLTIADATGQRRLDNPNDVVRLEIKTALDQNIRVIPVLIRGATMPGAQDLPDGLEDLRRRNALEISDTRFHEDVNRLIRVLDQVLGVSRPTPRRLSRGLLVGIGLAVLAVIIGLLAFFAGRGGGSGEIDTEAILMALAATATEQAKAGITQPEIDLEDAVATAVAATEQARELAVARTPTAVPGPANTPTPLLTPTDTSNPSATSVPSSNTLTPTPTRTATSTPTSVSPEVVSSNTINVRNGPGTNYSVIGELQPDSPLAVIGKNEQGTWWQVQYTEDTVGWVANTVVDVRGSDSDEIAIIPATLIPTPSVLQTITAADGAPMVLVPAGPFAMGSDISIAQPVHEVTLDAFYIDRYEVTNVRYATCVEAGVCEPPAENSSATRESYYGNPDYDDYPVIWVTSEQARTYCEWRGDRLPTEAEWEKAARGTDGRIYPWGNADPNEALLNYSGNVGDTTPVGQYSPDGDSPYGAVDMAGNVWEWVADWWAEDYYANSPSHNPQGPDGGIFKVLRGGSWGSPNYSARSDYRFYGRYGYLPGSGPGLNGFRCVGAAPE